MKQIRQQTARQWLVTHEWMVKPMQQTEWIEKQGLLIWLAEVFSSLGTGLYLVSILSNNWWGALFGYAIIVLLKLPLHFVYLGKPLRFWRCLPPFTRAWRTSWIARGFAFTTMYAAMAMLQLVSSYLLPGSAADIVLKVVAGCLCVMTGLYCGFMMSVCKSIPFWHTGLLPIVILMAGIGDGLALLIGVGLYTGSVDIAQLESVTRILLIMNAMLIGTLIIRSFYRSPTAGVAAREMVAGRAALPFWMGVVMMGIMAPLAISLLTLHGQGNAAHGLMIAAVAAHTIGAFSLKYCILKVGIYEPIIPRAKERLSNKACSWHEKMAA